MKDKTDRILYLDVLRTFATISVICVSLSYIGKALIANA